MFSRLLQISATGQKSVAAGAGDTLSHRADIDGLRAVAVLLIMFFHLGWNPTGGFIGVDVFFVISGFLITTIILRDIEVGRFSFAAFYAPPNAADPAGAAGHVDCRAGSRRLPAHARGL